MQKNSIPVTRNHRSPLTAAALSIAIAGLLAPVVTQAQSQPARGLEDLLRLEHLPAFKTGRTVAMFSSYDRTGGNDDGFSGTHSFLRKEGDRLVIAEMKGPGSIDRIWTPTPTDDLVEFFFDDEPEPRLSVRFRDLFSGEQFPFVRPVVGMGAGGFYSYVPLTYQKSCKVTIKAPMTRFYQINYSTYASDAGVETFDPSKREAVERELQRAGEILSATGADISRHVAPADAKITNSAFSQTLQPGGRVDLYQSDAPGRIVGITLAPARALAGLGRDVLLNVYYDGATDTSFSCPAGDFFGFSFGQPATRSLMLGTHADTCYAYWPMPYAKSIRIELASENPQAAAIAVHGEIKHADRPRTSEEGQFFAVWNRENPTQPGKPYTFIDTRGKGHLVGVIQQAQGNEPGGVPLFFEGDDQTTIDGKLVIHGTGSEDFYNGGWYDVPGQWEDRVTLPLSGALEYKRYLGRTGGYRLLLADPYPFETSIRSTIEHGPTDNAMVTDYASVTYLYADAAAGATTRPLPSQAERAVTPPARAVFAPGISMPVYAFSRDRATLSKHEEKIGEHNERFLRLDASAANDNGHGSQYLTLIADVPAAGRYRVSIDAVAGPNGATVQLMENQYPLGEAQDLYAQARGVVYARPLGEVDLNAGENNLTLRLVARNKAATGNTLEIIRLTCERMGGS